LPGNEDPWISCSITAYTYKDDIFPMKGCKIHPPASRRCHYRSNLDSVGVSNLGYKFLVGKPRGGRVITRAKERGQMASSKGKKGKKKKNTQGRKSRLWLRDLLNILGGLLVGAFGFWIVQELLADRTARDASQRYRTVIQEDLPVLEQASEEYEALAQNEEDVLEVPQGVDITVPLYRLDAYKTVPDDLPCLDAEARPLLLSFYLNLRDVELLRKLIVEQREHPQEMPQILTREFLRTLDEGTQLVPRLRWALGPEEEAKGRR